MIVVCKYCNKEHEALLFKNGVWKYLCNDIIKVQEVTTERRVS